MNQESRAWGFASRWGIPFSVTLLYLWFLRHTNEAPQILSRYSPQYFLFLCAVTLLAVVAWWTSLTPVRHQTFQSRVRKVPICTYLILIAVIYAFFDVIAPVERFPALLAVIPLALLIIIGTIFRSHPTESTNRLALLMGSALVGLLLGELAFRSIVLMPSVPRSDQQFAALVSSAWPRQIHPEAGPDTFRILGLSDSFGRAGGPDNYHYILEELLRQAGTSVEVVNFSVDAYEPTDQLKLLRGFAGRYTPDLVLHGFFVGNDFSVPEADLMQYRGIGLRSPTGVAAFRPRNFTLIEWLRRYRRVIGEGYARETERDRGKDIGAFSEETFLAIERQRLVEMSSVDPPPSQRWHATLRVLDDIQEKVRKMGARYVMVIHPDQFQVEHGLLKQIAAAYGLDLTYYDIELPQRFLLHYCDSLEIPCLDLLPAFRIYGSEGGLYLLRDTHYNREGNRLAAKFIRAFLHERQLLEPERRVWSKGENS